MPNSDKFKAFKEASNIPGRRFGRHGEIKGWHINIPDEKGREAVSNPFAYTEEERDLKIKFAMGVSKYPDAISASPCWISDSEGRMSCSPKWSSYEGE